MTIAFFSNFFNHHQKMVADQLYELTDGGFTFVETVPLPSQFIKAGYPDLSETAYVLKAWESPSAHLEAIGLAKSADVAIFDGPEALDFEIIRARKSNMISFDVSERWLKKGFLNILSPRLLKFLFYYLTLFRSKRVYKLCASAFCANDMYKLNIFKNRCFKWGYFTPAPEFDVSSIVSKKFTGTPTFMWCARFIDWKHPEIPVFLARKLKDDNIECKFEMYGSGPLVPMINKLISKLDVSDIVTLKGNVSNDNIHRKMRTSDIYLFTSDRNEGWGAVANEAMANACVVIASDQIGSTPYIINDGINGRIFPSGNVESLFEIVKSVISNPVAARSMAIEAHKTLNNEWSARTAAQNFINLSTSLSGSLDMMPKSGPGSLALPV